MMHVYETQAWHDHNGILLASGWSQKSHCHSNKAAPRAHASSSPINGQIARDVTVAGCICSSMLPQAKLRHVRPLTPSRAQTLGM